MEYRSEGSRVQAVNDVSFTIDEGERLGLVGESGCGKTTVAKSIMGLLPDNGEITNGTIKYTDDRRDLDLVTAEGRALRDIRWENIAMISQSAMNALDPVYTVGDQIVEAIQLHEDTSEKEARERARELLDRVGIEKDRISSYPHQLSGGMRQRVMIAMALSLNPNLILADEPTTALDVITQDHILDQIDELSRTVGNSLLMITHDISVISETCDRIGVMYGGELVEIGPLDVVFKNPEHPYTQGLLNAFPTLEGDDSELITMRGEPPDLTDPPSACNFADRCPYSEERCSTSKPELSDRGNGQNAKCFVTDDGYDLGENYKNVLRRSEKWQTL